MSSRPLSSLEDLITFAHQIHETGPITHEHAADYRGRTGAPHLQSPQIHDANWPHSTEPTYNLLQSHSSNPKEELRHL